MMDSTTITLFDNILKGVGRHPKSGRKKGGMKVRTVMKYQVGVPMVVQLTSAAKHDHYLLKEVHLPKDSTLAMDRAYIDIAQLQRLTEEGVCYVTKMKRDLTYGGADRQPAHHRALQEHQAALRLLAGGHHGAPYADGVHRFHRVHGEPGQNVG